MHWGSITWAENRLSDQPRPNGPHASRWALASAPRRQLVTRPLVGPLHVRRAGEPGPDHVGQVAQGRHDLRLLEPLFLDALDGSVDAFEVSALAAAVAAAGPAAPGPAAAGLAGPGPAAGRSRPSRTANRSGRLMMAGLREDSRHRGTRALARNGVGWHPETGEDLGLKRALYEVGAKVSRPSGRFTSGIGRYLRQDRSGRSIGSRAGLGRRRTAIGPGPRARRPFI